MTTNIEIEDDEVEVNLEADETEETETEEYVPPTKEEYTRLQAQLTKVNAEAKKHRLAAKAAKENAAKPADDTDEVAKQVAEAEAKSNAKYKPIIVKQAATLAFKEAGLTGGSDKLVKLLDLDDLDINDDGTIDGLDEQVDSLKEDFPDLFKKQRPGSADTARVAEGKTGKPKTSAERFAASVLGK